MKERLELNLKEFNAYGNMFSISERKELIGEMLRALREEYDLTQSEVSKYLEIKPGTYSTYENGTREAPAEIVVRLSLLYGVPTDVILQQTRMTRDGFDAQKQIDLINDQLQEIWCMATNGDTEISPEFKDFMSSMTDAFGKMGESLSNLNETIKTKKEENQKNETNE